MAEAKDKSVDQSTENATQPVTAKTGEVSDAELGKVVGGKGSVQLFEISDYSFDIEQTLSIGSQSSGAGAGKA